MSKTYTIEQAQTIGKGVLSASKADVSKAGLVQWAAEVDTVDSFKVLAAAIQVAADAKGNTELDKKVRKGALAVWATTLKRVRKGEKTAAKGEQDCRQHLAHMLDEGKVTVYWKTPEVKDAKGGEGEGEEGEAGKAGELSDADLLALVQARIESSEAFASQVEELIAAMIG